MFHAVKITNSYGLKLNYMEKSCRRYDFSLFFFKDFIHCILFFFRNCFCFKLLQVGLFCWTIFVLTKHNRDVGPKKVKLFIGHT
jgi:hypothetical protein